MAVTFAPYPAELEDDVTTDIGTLHVRPIRTTDGAALIAFHERLSPGSQYLRFFNAHPHLSATEVERFTHVDYTDRLALVAELEGELIGVGRYDRVRGSTMAEVAFVVADAYQCHGVGSLLLRRLVDAAAARGIARFTAETLADNRRMQAVFRGSGYPVHARFEDGVVMVEFTIVTDTP